MKLSRRQALQIVILGGSMFAAEGARMALAASYKPSLFLLGDITPSTSASRLFSALDPIVSQNVPVGCVIDLTDTNGQLLSPNGELANLFRDLLTDYSGLVELIVRVPALINDTPYFKMRRSSEAQAQFRQVCGSKFSCLSLATDMPVGNFDEINEIRAGGFRNILLVPDKKRTAGYWETEGGILQFYGGNSITSANEKNVVGTALSGSKDDNDVLIVYVSLDANSESDDEAFQFGANVGDTLSIRNMSGETFSTLPAELHLRSNSPYGRLIGLRVDQDHNRHTDSATLEFMKELSSAGVPFSLVTSVPLTQAESLGATANSIVGEVGNNSSDICLRYEAGVLSAEVASGLAKANTACLSIEGAPSTIWAEVSGSGVEVISDASDTSGKFFGLDKYGVFHAPVEFKFDGNNKIRKPSDAFADLLNAVGSQRDIVISVTTAAIQDPIERQAIVDALATADKSNIGKIASLNTFRDRIAPPDDNYRLLTSMKLRRALSNADSIPVDDTERAELIKDAKIAWGFFEKFTDPNTGLAPGTVWKEGEERNSYPFATMWDVGTMIMALVSAHLIGTIDDIEFDNRVQKLLKHIPTAKINGLLLPQASTSVTGRQAGQSGFDATDAGRLLISLKVLEDHTSGALNISDIVAAWDFEGTITDGEISNIRNGRFTTPQRSNYTHYLSRGFSLWGINVNSPYPVNPEDSETDAQMRVLGVAEYGDPISTEPNVLEEVEIGYSDAARTIADVLYTEQMAEYKKTGKLTCVSEGPLNREPWFSYQGYKIGDDDPWKVNTIENIARYQTAGFKRAVAMVSSKGAFLWAAVRPEPYSRLLVEHIREKARIEELGFASGVFTATGSPTSNYSDINTNGVILEAITYRLRKNNPLLHSDLN